MENREYYVVTDYKKNDSGIFTTMKGVSQFLHIHPRTVSRNVNGKYKYLKKGCYLIVRCQITKSNNRGNIDNFNKASY